jgi:hypothetical protein
MIKIVKYYLFAFLVAVVLFIFFTLSVPDNIIETDFANTNYFNKDDFNQYWWQSKSAEIGRYELHQERYNEIHPGYALLIFVTEDFNLEKQVKKETENGQPSIGVLKLNFIKKFNTGIYDYSMMSSVFTPIDADKYMTLKITTTSQEWCGQSFSQMNYKDGYYLFQNRSYFEKESDTEYMIPEAITEEALFTTIRLNPHLLPIGEIKIIPSAMYARLTHIKLTPMDAHARLIENFSFEEGNLPDSEIFNTNKTSAYVIKYRNLNRQIIIYFQKRFPYIIKGWDEISVKRSGDYTQTFKTTSRLKKIIRSPYWKQNKLKDKNLRKSLDLNANT